MKRGLLLPLAIVIIAGSACLSAWLLYQHYFKVYHGYKPQPFSKQVWASADPETRGYMVKDLLAKHELKGLTSEQVKSLLGPPDCTHTNEADGAPSLYGYCVGYMGFNPNAPMAFSYELRVGFDGNGLVDRAYVDD